MRNSNYRPVGISMRLDAIVKYLGVGKHWDDHGSERDVIDACVEKVNALIPGTDPHGEALASRVANHYKVLFEKVRDNSDIDLLEKKYLKEKKEIGFAMLRDEIISPDVDALLFHRHNATVDDLDQWVAVLNLMFTEDRAYWNMFHELSHRLAEPPQKFFSFRKQLVDSNSLDDVEKLMDNISGNIAFHPKLFIPYFPARRDIPLDFQIIEEIRRNFAPTASLLSVTNAVIQRWERPAIAFVAAMKPKKYGPQNQLALRIIPQARNKLSYETDFRLFKNMRVPESSCIYQTFRTGFPETDVEQTTTWTTCNGSKVPNHTVTVSAIRLDKRVYGVMTI
jgi:hypothetical protein